MFYIIVCISYNVRLILFLRSGDSLVCWWNFFLVEYFIFGIEWRCGGNRCLWLDSWGILDIGWCIKLWIFCC